MQHVQAWQQTYGKVYPLRVAQTWMCQPTLTVIRCLDKILSRTVRPYLGALSTTWCRTMTHMANVHRQLPEWWRHWWYWLALMFHRPESRLYEPWCWTWTTVCPEAHWCFDPSLQGKPKDTIQMLPGLNTGTWGPCYSASSLSLWFVS